MNQLARRHLRSVSFEEPSSDENLVRFAQFGNGPSSAQLFRRHARYVGGVIVGLPDVAAESDISFASSKRRVALAEERIERRLGDG